MAAAEEQRGYSLPSLDFSRPPEALYKVFQAYRDAHSRRSTPNTNFLKGAKWSPDGGCLLTASDDARLRVFDLPPDALDAAVLATEPEALAAAGDSLAPAICVSEGETVYDFAWFPAMHAADPQTCVFAATSRAHPAHLWDACSGELRGSYRAYDAADEVTAAHSLAFSPDGGRLVAGFSKAVRAWDVSRPGRECQQWATHRKGGEGLPGIVSCLDFNPDRSGLMAAGSYCGQAALLDSRSGELLSLLQGQRGGLTQVRFTPDGNFLLAGARADGELWCWDVRFGTGAVYRLARETRTTNQRMLFDVEPLGRLLATGGQDGCVRVFDLSSGQLAHSFKAADDTVNSVQFHPFLPLAATASGQRRFWDGLGSDSEGEAGAPEPDFALNGLENVLAIWRVAHEWVELGGSVEPEGAPQQPAEAGPQPEPEAAAEAGDAVMSEAALPAKAALPAEAALPAQDTGAAASRAAPSEPARPGLDPSTGFAGLPKLKPLGGGV